MLKELQTNAIKSFAGKEINCNNLYERINTNSYQNLEDSLKIIEDIKNEDIKYLYETDLDTDYVYGTPIIDFFNGVIATYLEDYIRKNHKQRNAVRDTEDLGEVEKVKI